MTREKDSFLNNMLKRIQEGEFDEFLTLPFMNRKLLFNNIKKKVDKRISLGGSGVLIDSEIIDSINILKETAAFTFKTFIESGIMEPAPDGNGYQISRKGKIALRDHIKYD